MNCPSKTVCNFRSQFLLCLLLSSNNAALWTTQERASKDRKLGDLEQNVVYSIAHSVVYVIICFRVQDTKYF
jgi:hypothetical protein